MKKRWAITLLLGVLLLGLLPLAFGGGALRPLVRELLEEQWGRPVQLDRVELHLLPEPSLRASGVSIEELEPFGAEPFLRTEQLHCRPDFAALLRGRLACARVHLVRPSLNLVRTRDGEWNLAAWNRRSQPGWPVFSAEQARINFKQDAEKKIYALADAALTLEPRPDAWQITLEARPFRTDQRLTETGGLRITGSWSRRADASGSVPLDLSLALGPGSLSQWYAFATGETTSLRADAAVRARLTGTWSRAALAGDLSLENLHRWDLTPGRSIPAWHGPFELVFTGATRSLNILRLDLSSGRSALSLRGRVANLGGPLDWDLELDAPALELDHLLAHYTALKENASAEAQIEGVARLQARLVGPLPSWTATFRLEQPARWRLPGIDAPVVIEPAEIRWQRQQLEAGPIRAVFPGEQPVELIARFSPQSDVPVRLALRGEAVELAHLLRTGEALGWAQPGASHWNGLARLALEWRGDPRRPETWRRWGSLELAGVNFHPPAVNHPLEIEEARVAYRAGAVEVEPLRMRMGSLAVQGRLERSAAVPAWRVQLAAERLNLAELDAWLNPERARGLLPFLRGVAPASPDAWDDVQASGHLEVETFEAGPFVFTQFHTDLELSERRLNLLRLRFRALGGQVRGSFRGDFRSSPPAYRFVANLKTLDLEQLLAGTRLGEVVTGHLGADVALETRGRGPAEWQRNLQGTLAGVVTGATLSHFNLLAALRAAAGLPPEEADNEPRTALESLAGEFRLANRRVRCQGARMVAERALLELSGEVDFEGRLNLRLRAEPLPVGAQQPSPAGRGLFGSRFELRGTLREPRVRLARANP